MHDDQTIHVLMAHVIEAQIEDFMRESNKIEGETDEDGIGLLHTNDVRAMVKFLHAPKITARAVLNLHGALSKPKLDAGLMKLNWCGQWREMDVRVGGYVPPEHKHVSGLMRLFFKNVEGMSPWQAHNHFEAIHPFVDLNGRVGRAIWLWKKYNNEGFRFGLSFLQSYYYDSLKHFEKLNCTFYDKENKLP